MNPSRSSESESILMQLSDTQKIVESFLQRVEVIEEKLKKQSLSTETRARMEKELADVKMKLEKSEHDLQYFYGENSKTFFIAVMLMFFSFLFYGLYIMIFGTGRIG